MGCSAAKNVAVAPIDTNEHGVPNKTRSGNHRKSTSKPFKDVDLHPGELENALVNNVQKAGNGMSFDITFDDNDDKNENLIQKHPPKRILELQESESKPAVTLEKLQEKLEEAEIRRQQILQQRTSANVLRRTKNTEILQSVDRDMDHEQSPHHLKVPKEESPHPPNRYDVAYS